MPESRYVRPSLPRWLTPALFGPWLGSYAAVTLGALLGFSSAPARVISWAAGMAFASLYAFGYMLALIAVDVALLAIRVRALPTGRRAWAVAVLGPAVSLTASFLAVWQHGAWKFGVAGVAMGLFVPALLTTVGARVYAGEKVHANR